MKKFRFLIFMLIFTSIFIGCAQPTDDTVIPEVPKTTTEEDDSEVSDAQPTWQEEVEKNFNLSSGAYTVSLANYEVQPNYNLNWTGTNSPSLYLDRDYKIIEDDKIINEAANSDKVYTFRILVFKRIMIKIVKTSEDLSKDDAIKILGKQDIFTITPKAK